DSWDEVNGSSDYTCCYAADLTGNPADLTYRIDHIFYLAGSPAVLDAVDAELTEQNNAEKIIKTDDTTIWSSDHVGIAVGFDIL
ncbi:MAG: hypothetical protein MUC95_10595, partial [Spirochaetes bacterium]|nr:hypothetical protein [Spirochaetota bacterium]